MYPDFDGSQLCAQVDPEIWFPEGSLIRANRDAMKICQKCHFVTECLEYAVQVDVQGIWGGTTYPQRKVIRKTRGIVAKPIFEFLSTTPQAIKAREKRALLKELQKEKEKE